MPYNDKELRSVYHIREYDVEKLMHVSHFAAEYPLANPVSVDTDSKHHLFIPRLAHHNSPSW